MNAREFKATALKCSDHYSVDFCTKKEMLDWCTDRDGNVCVLDDDTHVYAWVGNEFFRDERVTSNPQKGGLHRTQPRRGLDVVHRPKLHRVCA